MQLTLKVLSPALSGSAVLPPPQGKSDHRFLFDANMQYYLPDCSCAPRRKMRDFSDSDSPPTTVSHITLLTDIIISSSSTATVLNGKGNRLRHVGFFHLQPKYPGGIWWLLLNVV
ncbi:hypothetical protein JOB18_010721 [Solea senegalensis]|uniref:Uncharacterized protein n=1 Tax=Solea senegalensis TaxID=28829 RepID=A0AAV6QSI9_SOLSE|nr:hypothetical protein JOB18_010721 [Solea senegalensis]